MEKAGWQVASGVLALVAVGGIFGTMVNKQALAERVSYERPCPEPSTETAIVREQIPQQPRYGVMEWPDGVRCQGGVLILRTQQGFESLTQNGRAMRCTENPYQR
jgi:hypothetical protein